MRRSVLSVLLVLFLVLAGCNGLVTGGDETPERTATPTPEQTATPASEQTITPAAVPTDEPTPTPVPQLAPGVTGEGVTDAVALAGAHASALRNTSYTFYRNITMQYANGTPRSQFAVRKQAAADDSRFYTVRNTSTEHKSGGFSLWSNGERVLIAETNDDTTAYTVPRSYSGEPMSPREAAETFVRASSPQIAALFRPVETHVVDNSTRNGTTRYRVVATNVTTSGAFRGQNPHNVTLRALISSRGLVRESELTYTTTLNDTAVRVRRHFRYTDIGNTTVERPSWYDEAVVNVSTATPTEAVVEKLPAWYATN